MECSQQANAEVMREMTRKLYSQYEEKLQEEQQRHNAEKEALLVCMSHLLMEQPGSVGCIIVENEVTQSCPTLCDLIDCSLPGSSVHGIFQAIVLEWIAISFSRGSSQPRARTRVSCIVDRRFTI